MTDELQLNPQEGEYKHTNITPYKNKIKLNSPMM